jgi:predicted nucleic acid-binding Zn ribbon protein
MPRMVGYQCEKCGHKDEELFNDTEKRPETLKRKCSECGGKLKQHDIKDNCQRYKFHDRGGL